MNRRLLSACLLPFVLCAPRLAADVSLSPLFSDHAVLQRSAKTAIFGKAAPGEDISIALGHAQATTHANADGAWHVDLDLARETDGPFDLVVQGKNKLTLVDVLVGEVWVASGQSNMDMLLVNTAGATEEIARSATTQIRQFRVQKNGAPKPLDTYQGQWVIADPKTSGDFSAVAYYFAKRLNTDLHKPVWACPDKTDTSGA